MKKQSQAFLKNFLKIFFIFFDFFPFA